MLFSIEMLRWKASMLLSVIKYKLSKSSQGCKWTFNRRADCKAKTWLARLARWLAYCDEILSKNSFQLGEIETKREKEWRECVARYCLVVDEHKNSSRKRQRRLMDLLSKTTLQKHLDCLWVSYQPMISSLLDEPTVLSVHKTGLV